MMRRQGPRRALLEDLDPGCSLGDPFSQRGLGIFPQQRHVLAVFNAIQPELWNDNSGGSQ
jgi:hypothetical protein